MLIISVQSSLHDCGLKATAEKKLMIMLKNKGVVLQHENQM